MGSRYTGAHHQPGKGRYGHPPDDDVERNIALGLTPVEATKRAMNEVTGPIIAIALVLCAVFVPTAFISGLTGQFYRQFALTIAISTVISAFARFPPEIGGRACGSSPAPMSAM